MANNNMSCVLGFSGLHYTVPYRARLLPHIDRRAARVVQGLDSAAALVTHDRVIAAAAEERFSRDKGTGSFPAGAIRYCLRAAALNAADLECVAHSFDYHPVRHLMCHDDKSIDEFDALYSRQAQLTLWSEHFPGIDWTSRLAWVPHHLAHAASTFYVSGLRDALVLVADGMGEQHSMTVATGTDAGLEVIAQTPAMHSLGVLYGVFTMYLGFDFNFDEYKVMGLAPYGQPRRFFAALSELVRLNDQGGYTIPVLFENKTELERQTYAGTLRALVEKFGPAREPQAAIEQRHMDIAAALQAVLEATLLHVLRFFKRSTGHDNLCFAGGVALNCSANGVIRRSRLFREIFVQPAAADDGAALGAALYACRQRSAQSAWGRLQMPLLGPEFSDAEISAALQARADCRAERAPSTTELTQTAADWLAQGKIIGWFQGRMEYGPRALGARSILADPRAAQMRERVNTLIKQREEFRPFAPAVLESSASEYFEIEPGEEPTFAHMLFVTRVREEFRSRLAAVTHVDGTARVQSVSRAHSERFWALIAAFGRKTGVNAVLNTSFNVRGQPIVCTPQEAIDTFVRAGLDALVIGDWLVSRAGVAA